MNMAKINFCALKLANTLYSENKFGKQKLFAVLNTYLLKAF